MMKQFDGQLPAIQANIALAIRVGLGLVFISGGLAKLERLLSPERAQGIVDQYVSPAGYINQTFLDWLFASPLGAVLTPWSFLTALSAFELLAGIMLVAGLMVRPMSLLWAFLLWSFVVSLPVVTTPGVQITAKTYMSPAEFVQIRDIALSGFFFALYNLGAGSASLDARRFGLPQALGRSWDILALLLRLSLGSVFVIGGFFAGHDNVITYGVPGFLLAVIGLGLVSGVGVRIFALGVLGVLLWFIAQKLGSATTVIAFMNSVKREFALASVAGALIAAGGGNLFRVDAAGPALRNFWERYALGARHATIEGLVQPKIDSR